MLPGQAGWWQHAEKAKDRAWFLDTGNNSPNCALWEWVWPGCSCPLGRVIPAPPAADAAQLSVPSAGFSCLIQARCDESTFVWTEVAGREWGAVYVEVDKGSKVEIQRGIKTFMLCKKGLGPCIKIKCEEVIKSCLSFRALVRCQDDKENTETKGLAKQEKDT